MPQVEHTRYWSTAYGGAWVERVWCLIWRVHQLSSFNITWCFLLQVCRITIFLASFCPFYVWHVRSMSDILFIFMCSQLKDDCLSATTTSCPLIESLILMSCQSIGPDGLYSLRSLQNLTMLDLSYTFLTNLEPVFESCLQLKVVLVSDYA